MAKNQLQYTSKDYKSIVTDLTDSISSLTDTWTSREDGDAGIVLVKLMASLGDMLSYNLDKQALEYYSATVSQRKNASKLYELIGYTMHWYQSATTTLSITNSTVAPRSISINYEYYKEYINATTEEDKQAVITKYDNDPNIPNRIDTSDVKTWLTTIKNNYDAWAVDNTVDLRLYVADQNATLNLYTQRNISTIPFIIEPTTNALTDAYGNILPTKVLYPDETVQYKAIQGSLKNVTFQPSKLIDNKFYIPTSNVDEEHMYLQCSSSVSTQNDTGTADTTLVWFSKVDNLLTQTDGGLHFQLKIDDFDFPYIELSSYWDKSLDDNSVTFTLYYVQTDGRYGNINKNVLTSVSSIASNRLTITHPETNTYLTDRDGEVIATVGKHPQTAKEAYVEAQNHVMTYNTLVTIYDFERFTKRQKGISNTYAVDGQRAKDLNDILMDRCTALTYGQLRDLIPEPTFAQATKEELMTELFNRRAVHYDFRQENREVDKTRPEDYTAYKDYGLNIHTVYGYFDTKDSEGNIIATLSQTYGTVRYPYYIYCINTDDSDYNKPNSIARQLDKAIDTCRIVNVKPEYTAVRVFPWRCCGTIHLTKPVSKSVADSILQTVINNLHDAFHPENLTFGERIKYMDIINIITSSSPLIQYFDAGMGTVKLIAFEEEQSNADINIESYFNNCSLMMYKQTFEENEEEYLKNEDGEYILDFDGNKQYSPYYKLLSIDSEYITD